MDCRRTNRAGGLPAADYPLTREEYCGRRRHSRSVPIFPVLQAPRRLLSPRLPQAAGNSVSLPDGFAGLGLIAGGKANGTIIDLGGGWLNEGKTTELCIKSVKTADGWKRPRTLSSATAKSAARYASWDSGATARTSKSALRPCTKATPHLSRIPHSALSGTGGDRSHRAQLRIHRKHCFHRDLAGRGGGGQCCREQHFCRQDRTQSHYGQPLRLPALRRHLSIPQLRDSCGTTPSHSHDRH